MTTCPRCKTYCYGDCTTSEGRRFERRAAAPVAKTSAPTIMIPGVSGVAKTREAWAAQLASDEARLARITDTFARKITEDGIAKIRAALA